MNRSKLMVIKLRKTLTKSEDADHNVPKINTATTPAIEKAGKGFPPYLMLFFQFIPSEVIYI